MGRSPPESAPRYGIGAEVVPTIGRRCPREKTYADTSRGGCGYCRRAARAGEFHGLAAPALMARPGPPGGKPGPLSAWSHDHARGDEGATTVAAGTTSSSSRPSMPRARCQRSTKITAIGPMKAVEMVEIEICSVAIGTRFW